MACCGGGGSGQPVSARSRPIEMSEPAASTVARYKVRRADGVVILFVDARQAERSALKWGSTVEVYER